MKYLLALLLLISSNAYADIEIIYLNKCIDYDWECLNKTQAALKTETSKQIARALKATRITKIRIFSVDPWRPDSDTWLFGARLRHGRVLFAADPTCPHARQQLERLLKRLK